MTPAEEFEFYAHPENQQSQGPARRCNRSDLTVTVPVRLPRETLVDVRRLAGADDRSVSSWIRLAVAHELDRTRG